MRHPRLLWQLFGSTLLVVLPALLLGAWFSYRDAQQVELRDVRSRLAARAEVVRAVLAARGAPAPRAAARRGPARGALAPGAPARGDPAPEAHTSEAPALGAPTPGVPALGAPALGAPASREGLERLVRRLARPGKVRITLIRPDGVVVADSAWDSSTTESHGTRMESHGTRPEVRAALAGRIGSSTRRSKTLGQEMMYHARPLRRDGRVVLVVRTAVALGRIHATLSGVLRRVGVTWFVVALLAVLLSLLLAQWLVRPLRAMQAGARRFAGGELRYRLAVPRTAETGDLAHAMNRMAEQLDERIRLVTSQRNQLEAVLSSMIEAVLVADARGRILRVNRAAVALLGLDPDAVAGASVDSALRLPELTVVFKRLLGDVPTVETELVLERQDRRHLQVIGTQLLDEAGHQLGAMVVLHDVSQLKRLESIRRDFVANVSHELRTPITSIHGYVETLRDGALKDPVHAERFLEIIGRQSARLSAIVDDLLCLSRIEVQGGAGQIEREEVPLLDLLQTGLAELGERAAGVGRALVVAGDGALRAEVNPPLLEQAVVNLVDNALKYGGPEGSIEVTLAAAGSDVVIVVRDAGPGIPAEDQPRIFERFYRVDRARSRAVGGTGLGLAIVKHIAVAHGGEVSLESAPGAGCTFRLRFPRATQTGVTES